MTKGGQDVRFSLPEVLKDVSRVAMLPTCLVDVFYSRVGEAVVSVLERIGLEVHVPPASICCGLPFYNNGYVEQARSIAQGLIEAFAGEEPIVVPSGSCSWMMRHVYPQLVPEGGAFATRVVEFSELMAHIPGWRTEPPAGCARATYHPSCHLLRGLGVADEPKAVLGQIQGVALCAMDREVDCCGFGGSFAVRYPELSVAMADDKLASAARTDAQALVVTDVGCMMQLEGRANHTGVKLRVLHLAELLAESKVRRP
jgi:L-lactate dehydrogenase complex protein LldE